jgi:hypothetical protein
VRGGRAAEENCDVSKISHLPGGRAADRGFQTKVLYTRVHGRLLPRTLPLRPTAARVQHLSPTRKADTPIMTQRAYDLPTFNLRRKLFFAPMPEPGKPRYDWQDQRRCFVCLERVPEGQAVHHTDLAITTHRAPHPCGELVDGMRKTHERSQQGRTLPRVQVLSTLMERVVPLSPDEIKRLLRSGHTVSLVQQLV